MTSIVLSNDSLSLEFDPGTGALVALTAVETSWEILNRPHVGLSYRLMVPQSGRRNTPVLGEEQPVASVELAPDGRGVTFAWDGVTTAYGDELDIRIVLNVALNDRQAVFAMTIDNQSDAVVENVYCPYLGDLQHPTGEAWLKTFLYSYASAQEWSLWPTYQNMRGYYGSDYPVQFSQGSAGSGAPMSPFILLRSEKQGLYAGVCASSSELVAWHTELRPGYGSSIDARVPEEPTIGGLDVATRFAAVHVPYIMPGETRSLTPVALEAYQGGWQQGVDIYKAWRSCWMELPEAPAWINEPHAWQQIHVNSPEDEARVPYRELVAVGEECAHHGVKAIQLTGWTLGGQDQANPSHDPDPKLGTFDELKEAIAEVQSMGVKLILFAKFTWADRATQRFRDELVKYAIKDPYGDYYHYQGYQYQTATQLLDINTKRLIPMCFLSEEYMRICEEEYQKTLDLGADGILFDECLHHSPSLLCFDTSHGHRYGAPVYANDRELIHRFAGMAERSGKMDFLFAGEACYDWQFDAYQFSYHRSESKTHIPLSRYMLPEVPLATAVTGFNDRNMVNQCLLYRYVISYEPYNFKGRLDDYPLTMAYGKQMDALRTELRHIFWDGEFRHTVGASVTVDGAPHHPYAVFTDRRSGQPGMAIANYDDTRPITADYVLDGGGRLSRYRLVDDAAWGSPEDGIVIPPRSAAVVI